MKPTAYIHHWGYFPDPYPHLRGCISDHPRQHEFRGAIQATSQIIKMPMKLAPGVKVETLNTLYILGFNINRHRDRMREKKHKNVTESSKES
jgi:hypothetical protein